MIGIIFYIIFSTLVMLGFILNLPEGVDITTKEKRLIVIFAPITLPLSIGCIVVRVIDKE